MVTKFGALCPRMMTFFKGFRARHRAEKQDKYDRAHHQGGMKEVRPLPDEYDPVSQLSLDLGQLQTSTSDPIQFPSPSHNFAQFQASPESINPSQPVRFPKPVTVRTLEPHLQFMCGPMLRYDTVNIETHTWLGFCCIVTADSGSTYQPVPLLQMRWTPSFDAPKFLEPSLVPTSPPEDIYQDVQADRIHVYHGSTDSYTFWRFRLCIPMGGRESKIYYSINHGAEIAFYIPAIGQNFRWVGHSCNGFSAGVDAKSFNGPDPVWNDLLSRHKALPFHALIGGGDQLYCDAIAKEPELGDWLTEKDQVKKKQAVMTTSMATALDRFFFSHYCNWFRSGAFGKAISCIPMLSMYVLTSGVPHERFKGSDVPSNRHVRRS